MKIDESIEKLAIVCEYAKQFVKRGDYETFDIRNFDGTYKECISFHPNGKCGCIELNDDYMFGIRCEHLIWAEGMCEGIEPFLVGKDKKTVILVYGNHKGTLVAKLLFSNNNI